MDEKELSTIHVINPNSSCSVTESLAHEISIPAMSLNVNIEYSQIDEAPAAIESSEDVALAHKLVTERVTASDADAYVIACFCDPGVEELRKMGYRNVFGIAESAMHMAANMGGKFGMISILDVSVDRHIEQVERAGLSSMLAGDLALNLGVLELEDIDLARPRIENIGRELVEGRGAKSLILGCAGMGIHRAWLQNLLNVPVIDPCWAGVAMATAALGTL